jgi:hypothetical protein
MWWIIGLSIALIGSIMMDNPITKGVMMGESTNFTNVLVGFILMVFGSIIVLIGFLASFMKVFAELIVEENRPLPGQILAKKS